MSFLLLLLLLTSFPLEIKTRVSSALSSNLSFLSRMWTWYHPFTTKAPLFSYVTQSREETKHERTWIACFRVRICTTLIFPFSWTSICWLRAMCQLCASDRTMKRYDFYFQLGYSLCGRNEIKQKLSGQWLRQSVSEDMGSLVLIQTFTPKLIKHSMIKLISLFPLFIK